MHKPTISRRIFVIFNTVLLTAITLLGIIPFIHLLSVSLSSNTAAMAGEVKLWLRSASTSMLTVTSGKKSSFSVRWAYPSSGWCWGRPSTCFYAS